MLAKILLLLIVSTVTVVYGQNPRFKVLYEWSYVNFTWPDEIILREAITAGKYVPGNNLISGIKYFNEWFYLTLPRIKPGVPATLARISALSHLNNTSPLLEPFPNWDMNTEGDCTALQNVKNVEIDTSGIMWIIDGGKTNTLSEVPNTKCDPRLLIFDLVNNLTIVNHVFSKTIVDNSSFLYDLVVDESDGGYAYITDNSKSDPGIIVYSMKKNRAWKVRDNLSMHAAAEASEIRVNGVSLSFPVNVASIAMGQRITKDAQETFVSQDRMVYYCPIASFHIYGIKSSDLKTERKGNLIFEDFGKKASQTDGMVADENGVLYYGLLSDNSIARWDTTTPFTSGQKVIARDPTYIQWPDSLAFDMSGNLLVVTNKLQKFLSNQVNPNEANYRILESKIGVKSYLYATDIKLSEISTEATTLSTTMHSENDLITNQTVIPTTTETENHSQSSVSNIYLNYMTLIAFFIIIFMK